MPATIPDFAPSEEFLSLTHEDIACMPPAKFRHLFAHSAVRRTKLEGLEKLNEEARAKGLGRRRGQS